MFKRIATGIIIVLLAVSIGSTSGTEMSNAFQPTSTEPVVRFEPQSLNVSVDQMFSLTVLVENVSMLYGIDIQITWNTTCLKYINHTATAPVETYPDGLLHESIMWFKNVVDETGVPGAEPETRYWISVVSMSGAPSFNGSGSAFTMTFKALNFTGATTLNFTNIQLADFNVQPIPYTSSNCVVEMIPHPVHNIDTGLDYTTIQEAINAPETTNGHAIFAEEGTYYEHVVINKTISLAGEDASNTIVSGQETGVVITVEADDAIIREFTIKDSLYDYSGSGILIESATNITIDSNVISNCWYGIRSAGPSSKIAGNTISNSYYGIFLTSSENSELHGNIVMNNTYGIYIGYSPNATLRSNSLNDNDFNFGFMGYSISHFSLDIDTSNTINGKPIYYLANQHNAQFSPNELTNAGFIALVNCSEVTVQGFQDIYGISLAFTQKSKIISNAITNSVYGAHLLSSSDNLISTNTITNSSHGSSLWFFPENNTITGNLLEENRIGIYLNIYSPNPYNEIYHNNFVSNNAQLVDDSFSSINIWDNGCEGNYWSNYNGTDLDDDGVGDTSLPWEGVDHYPLMNLYWNPGDVDHDLDVDLYDAVKLLTAYGSKIGDDHYDCHCDIVELYGVINLYDAVLLLVNYGKKYN